MRPSVTGQPDSAPRTGLECRAIDSAAGLAEHFAIRRQVFVHEQGLFTADDRDEHDTEPDVIHAVGLVEGTVCGTVRLYPLGTDVAVWQGDRLAVLCRQRHVGLAAPLVRFAVGTAGDLGGREMLAYVQLTNVGFFERLGWSRVGDPEVYVGVPHQRMITELRRRRTGPPRADADSSPTRA